jgi:hypothetical protein
VSGDMYSPVASRMGITAGQSGFVMLMIVSTAFGRWACRGWFGTKLKNRWVFLANDQADSFLYKLYHGHGQVSIFQRDARNGWYAF